MTARLIFAALIPIALLISGCDDSSKTPPPAPTGPAPEPAKPTPGAKTATPAVQEKTSQKVLD